MKLNSKAYIVFAVVFLLSIVTFFSLPNVDEAVRVIMAIPGASALVAALFQLMRDEAAYEKQLAAQRREFQFALGAASHMANTAFDKHVEFCEKYMSELHEAVRTMYREGDTKKTLTHATNLYGIRRRYATWLTDRINTDLEEFESALRQLGAGAGFIESTRGVEGYAKQRAIRIERNFELFSRILGLKTSKGIQEKSMVEALESKVRAILGVEELTRLRDHLIKQASQVMDT